jgi:hypothetical protein
VCRQHATYRWKAVNKGYNFDLDLIAIGGLHAKLCALKVAGVPIRSPRTKNSWLPIGSPRTKNHSDVAHVERCKIYYKGKLVASPKSGPWWVLYVRVVRGVLAPKVLQLCINHFVLILCRSVWVIEACQFFLVPSWSSNTPLYPFIVLQSREWPWLLVLPPFSVWDSRLSPSRSWEHVK